MAEVMLENAEQGKREWKKDFLKIVQREKKRDANTECKLLLTLNPG